MSANVYLDGTDIDDMKKIKLSSEVGTIRAKNLIADEIVATSRLGDVHLDCSVEGNVQILTGGTGHVNIRGSCIAGDSLAVTTDKGAPYFTDLTQKFKF